MDATRPENGTPVKKDGKQQATAGVHGGKTTRTTTPNGIAAPRTPAPASQLGSGGGKVAPQDAHATTTTPASPVKGPEPVNPGQPVQQKTAETRHTSPARSSTGSQFRCLIPVVPALQDTKFGPGEMDENGYPLYIGAGEIASIVQEAKKRKQELIAAGFHFHKAKKAKL